MAELLQIALEVDASRGTAAITGFTGGVDKSGRAMQQAGKDADAWQQAGKRLQEQHERNVGKLSELETAAMRVAGAFGLWKIAQQFQDAVMLGARYETLGVVLRVVGDNAGYSAGKIMDQALAVRGMGISMNESMQSVTRLVQANLDLSKATQLARVAQDAAVIGGINSSEAYQRLVLGIRSGEIEILRTIGINVQFEDSYQKLAKALGISAANLTESQKATARMNAVLAEGRNIAGVYEASMTTAGKQIKSFERYVEDLKTTFGTAFTPALSVAVQAATEFAKSLTDALGSEDVKRKIEEIADSFMRLGRTISDQIGTVSPAIKTVFGSVLDGWNATPDLLKEVGLVGAVFFGAKGRLLLAGIAAVSLAAKELLNQLHELDPERFRDWKGASAVKNMGDELGREFDKKGLASLEEDDGWGSSVDAWFRRGQARSKYIADNMPSKKIEIQYGQIKGKIKDEPTDTTLGDYLAPSSKRPAAAYDDLERQFKLMAESDQKVFKLRIEAQRDSLDKSLALLELEKQRKIDLNTWDHNAQQEHEAAVFKVRAEWGRKQQDMADKVNAEAATATMSRYEREQFMAQFNYEQNLKRGMSEAAAAKQRDTELLKAEQDHAVAIAETHQRWADDKKKADADWAKDEQTILAGSTNAHEAKLLKLGADYNQFYRDLMQLQYDDGISEEEYAQKAVLIEKWKTEQTVKLAQEARSKQIGFEMELAKANHDSNTLKALEYEKYVLELEKTDYTREQKFALAQAKLQEINASALDKMLLAWQDTDKLVEDATKNTLQGIQNSFADVIGRGLKGEIKSLGDAWELMCNAMVSVFAQVIAQIVSIWTLSNLASLFTDKPGVSIGNLLSGGGGGGGGGGFLGVLSTLVSGAKVANTGYGLATGNGLGGGLGGVIADALGLGKATSGFGIADTSTYFAGSSDIMVNAGDIAAFVSDMEAGFTGVAAAAQGASAGLEAAGIAGTVTANAGVGVGASGAATATLGSTAAYGSMAAMPAIAWAGPVAAAAVAAMTIYSSAQESEMKSTREYARWETQNIIGAVGRMTSGLGQVIGSDGDVKAGGFFSQRTLKDIKEESDYMKAIGERAGLTTHHVDLLTQGMAGLERQMQAAARAGNKELAKALMNDMAELQEVEQQTGISTAALNSMSGAYAQISQASDLIGPKIAEFVRIGQEGMYSVGGAVQTVGERMAGLAESMGLPRDATEALKQKLSELIGQWDSNQISAETLSAMLQNQFVLALQSAATEGYNVKTALDAIPKYLDIEVHTRYTSEGEGGGLSAEQHHHGGWAGDASNIIHLHSGLRADEFLAVLQTGEPVFSRSDVERVGGPKAVENFRRGGSVDSGTVNLNFGDIQVSAQGLDISNPAQNRKVAAQLVRNIRTELAKLDIRTFGTRH
ncbi:MAG: hypothetical protein V1806_05865 [Pseudomonadota bacterium]